MRKRNLVIANWKMNPVTISGAKDLFTQTKRTALKLKRTTVVVCPPAIYLSVFSGKSTQQFLLGAQNTFWIQHGSYTGEISPAMLQKLGVKYCIVGHSERRRMGETNSDVSRKVAALLNEGIIPVICVGEESRDQSGVYLSVLEEQIIESLSGIPKSKIPRIILAYEPVWAIGKKAEDAMSSQDVHQTVLFIRKIMARVYGRKVGMDLAVIYGGSVEPGNIEELFTSSGIAGVLVGHASLSPKMMDQMLKTIDLQ